MVLATKWDDFRKNFSKNCNSKFSKKFLCFFCSEFEYLKPPIFEGTKNGISELNLHEALKPKGTKTRLFKSLIDVLNRLQEGEFSADYFCVLTDGMFSNYNML